MIRLGFKCLVYHGDSFLGELETVPVKDSNFQFPNNEIRIHHISPISERCPPLSILQTISSSSVRCKLESNSPIEQSHLINLHASCFYEMKTAVVRIGDEEVHLVAMPSKMKKFPCFWCYSVPCGIYSSCLGLLNMRCLAIVFDLDETLIVANTMKSFEDRIDALRGWIGREFDPVRASGMAAEMKRYMEDRALLKQYTENDSVTDNGKLLKVQFEEVPPLSGYPERIVRPVIRLPERNVVLTRINPENRDTSVLVRLRPAWEDLRSYLTAKGRKRFEVYVCTMAERDYALEMWRLLDPEAHLIGPKQLLGRVVCVKSGFRKSLLNVFRDGICHPKMAMVIDDRSKVWEDKDQPRVHVVPPFTPYYAPQAETASAVPVLCVARNVACNVRGGFFKEFDENLIRRISELFYEDEVVNLPSAPDVSSYLMSEVYEDGGFVSNGNVNAPIAEGMAGTEVERRFNQDERNIMVSAAPLMSHVSELRSDKSVPPVATVPSVIGTSALRTLIPSQKPSLLGPPVRHDGMKHGQDIRNQSSGDPPILPRIPTQVPVPLTQPQGGWLVEESISRGHLKPQISMFTQDSGAIKLDKQQPIQNPFYLSSSSSTVCGLLSHPSQVKGEEASVGHEWQRQNLPPTPTNQPSGLLSHPSQVKGEEASVGHEWQRQYLPPTNQPQEVGVSQNQMSRTNRELQTEVGKLNSQQSSLPIGVLQEIGRRCSSKVEFRPVVSTSKDLQFSVEVFFTGEKIGVGMGKTRKDAQLQAAENALHSLADKYVGHAAPRSGAVDRDFNKLSLGKENGILWESINTGLDKQLEEDGLPKESSFEVAEAALTSTSSNEINQQVQKRANSPRLLQSIPSKRSKEEQLRGSQNLSFSRHQKNGNPIT